MLIVVRRGDEFLVVHRSPENDGYWHQIAGGVEHGETFADAAVRELHEETGLEAGVQPLDVAHVPRTRAVRVVEAFLVDVQPAWEPTLDWEHVEYRWLPARGSRRAPLLARAGGARCGHCRERAAAAVYGRRAARAVARQRGRLDPPLRAARRQSLGDRDAAAPALLVPARLPARDVLGRVRDHRTRRRPFPRRRPRPASPCRRARLARADANAARRCLPHAGGDVRRERRPLLDLRRTGRAARARRARGSRRPPRGRGDRAAHRGRSARLLGSR